MKTVLCFYKSAFMMWRRRLADICATARAEGWHVESIDDGELGRVVRHDSADVVKKAIRELFVRNFDSYGYVHYRTRHDWSVERETSFRRELAAGFFGSTPLERRHPTRKAERVDMRAVRAVEYVRTNACKGVDHQKECLQRLYVADC